MLGIPINEIASHIDRVILERGRGYWHDGAVCDLEQIDENQWSASVDGTILYEVDIVIQNNKIIDYACTCPYDFGPVCKHIVAVVFAIQDYLEQGEGADGGEQAIERKPVVKQIDEALLKMDHRTLRDFVRNIAKKNRRFRSKLLSQVVFDSGKEGKAIYKQLVQESLREGMDYHGCIDYWHSREAVRGVEELLQKAERLYEEGDFKTVISIYQAVMEELVPALQYADDSNGDIGGAIGWAVESFYKVVEAVKDGNDKKVLFSYCLKESQKDKYQGWDWKWDFLRNAAILITTDQEKRELYSVLDEMGEQDGASSYRDDYNQERVAEIKFKILEREGDKEAEEDFINANLHLTDIRSLAIQRAFFVKDYVRVKALAQQGLHYDMARGFPGLVRQWREWLLEVAEIEKDCETVKQLLKDLFLDSGDLEYYDKLKKLYSKSEWSKCLKQLLEQLKREKWSAGSVLPKIYIKEKMWEDLLADVRRSPSLCTFDQYHKYLAPHFPKELITMYENYTREALIPTTGRDQYQQVCRLLRRMKKLGAKGRVAGLIDEFRDEYKNRPALRDELNKV